MLLGDDMLNLKWNWMCSDRKLAILENKSGPTANRLFQGIIHDGPAGVCIFSGSFVLWIEGAQASRLPGCSCLVLLTLMGQFALPDSSRPARASGPCRSCGNPALR